MPAQTLAQLESIVVAPSRDTLEDPDVLEDDEGAVQRALRDVGAGVGHQFGHGDGTAGKQHQVEDLATKSGVPLTDLRQASLGSGVDRVAVGDMTVVRFRSRHERKGIGR